MASVMHLVAESVDPKNGGLEQSVARIAGFLAAESTRVFLYCLEAGEPESLPAGVELVRLDRDRRLLLEPLGTSHPGGFGPDLPVEGYQVAYLCLLNAVERRLREHPSARHLVVSFFLSYAGFVAHQAAAALALPHVASIRGSDFSRDFRHPYRTAAAAQVAAEADGLVATNREQQRLLERRFRAAGRVSVIYNSVALETEPDVVAQPGASGGPVRLVNDDGYSFKKGSHLLFRSIAALREKGLPVVLTVAGATDRRRAYWEVLRRDYGDAHGDAFRFGRRIEPEEVESFLAAGDVYCSATLGEGASTARLRALALGLPIVSTRCGALADLAHGAAHVLLAPPGDADAFTEHLELMVRRFLAEEIRVDPPWIRRCRTLLDPRREKLLWREVTAAVLEGADRGGSERERGEQLRGSPSAVEAEPVRGGSKL